MRWRFWERKSAPSDALSEIIAGLRSSSTAGVTVNTKTAMESTVVLACARVIAEGLAQVPARVHQTRPDGGRVSLGDHPVSMLLGKRPNPWQTGFELREQIGLHLALCGNAFVMMTRALGDLVELYAFEPGSVTVEQRADLSLDYRVTAKGGMYVNVPASMMWHLRGPSWNGYLGMDAVAQARNAIGLGIATERFASGLFSNGARPGGLLSTEQQLSPEQMAALRDQWAAQQAGVGNAMRTALLTGGIKFQSLSQTPEEAQFIESRKFAVVEVCRAMRVNPIMVMHNDEQASYSSVEQRFIAHHRDTLAPWFERFEASADVNLFTEQEQRAGLYLKLDGNALMRGTAKDRYEAYEVMLRNGVVSRNEVRAWEDWEPYPDQEFDRPTPAANIYGPKPGSSEDE